MSLTYISVFYTKTSEKSPIPSDMKTGIKGYIYSGHIAILRL